MDAITNGYLATDWFLQVILDFTADYFTKALFTSWNHLEA